MYEFLKGAVQMILATGGSGNTSTSLGIEISGTVHQQWQKLAIRTSLGVVQSVLYNVVSNVTETNQKQSSALLKHCLLITTHKTLSNHTPDINQIAPLFNLLCLELLPETLHPVTHLWRKT